MQELLQEHGLEVSHDTLREWNIKFSLLIAEALRHRESRRGSQWHMDEVWILSANSSRTAKCRKTRCPGRFALL
ncbi:transposase-like protein, partial [Deinococcus sp. UYEF24]